MRWLPAVLLTHLLACGSPAAPPASVRGARSPDPASDLPAAVPGMPPLTMRDEVYVLTERLRTGDYPPSAREPRQVLLIEDLEMEVNNGGLHQYYFNSASDWAREVPGALRAVGAHRMADIVATANARFGPDGPPADRAARQALLDDMPEDAFEELTDDFLDYPDPLGELVVRYVNEYRAAFERR